MLYREAIEYLYALAPRGMELGLARLQQALDSRGNPERACPSVIVAGTNGKGSVASMIAAALSANGQRVGLFTSPHLHRLVERFRIDGRPISQAALARHVTGLKPFLERAETPPLTFFEVATLLAFELFREARCTIMVLEVGLGGRLDSTNVVTPALSVITSIALDHTDRLGPTIAHVAREKAGVIKRGVPVVSGARQPDAARVIAARARALGAPLLAIDRDFASSFDGRRYEVQLRERRMTGIRLALAGGYQADNLGCALAALAILRERFALDDQRVKRALARVRWPGRLELIEGAPSLLFDAAHNPHACQALARHLATSTDQYARRVLLFGVMRDKDHAQMIATLRPHFDAMVFVTPATPRAQSAEELAERYGGEAAQTIARGLRLARKRAGKRGLVVVCGSIFAMAPARALTLGLREDAPITL